MCNDDYRKVVPCPVSIYYVYELWCFGYIAGKPHSYVVVNRFNIAVSVTVAADKKVRFGHRADVKANILKK